jgi:hypothetical protein
VSAAHASSSETYTKVEYVSSLDTPINNSDSRSFGGDRQGEGAAASAAEKALRRERRLLAFMPLAIPQIGIRTRLGWNRVVEFVKSPRNAASLLVVRKSQVQ